MQLQIRRQIKQISLRLTLISGEVFALDQRDWLRRIE